MAKIGRKTNYESVREEDRRAKISIVRCLKKLSDIEEELEKNGEGLGPGAGPYIGSLRLRADIALKLLNKRLPDLKAVEHSGTIGDRPIEELDDGDLAGELAALRKLVGGANSENKGKKRPSRVH